MVIQDFLQWMGSASSARRAEATGALARAWLHSQMPASEREAAEAAMTLLVEDPDPLVRAALADALGESAKAPRHVVLALAGDIAGIAELVLLNSPLFMDSELVDFAAAGNVEVQAAIAMRRTVSKAVCAAIAEVGEVDACLELLGNPGAEVGRRAMLRMVERFKGEAEFRRIVMDSDRVPVAVKQQLVVHLSATLSTLPEVRDSVRGGDVDQVIGEARDRMTISLVARAAEEELSELVEHLRASAQLTPALMLRALCTGEMAFFECALAVLTGLPETRVEDLISEGRGASLRALISRSGLPRSTHEVFLAGIACFREIHGRTAAPRTGEFTRQMVRGMLQEYSATDGFDPLMRLLHRLEAEGAREAARSYIVEQPLLAAA